ncbi:MAG: UTP--glucose-1-phosphate uridylyltransferase [Acidimicrobiaceae bacterium]|nr:UTP--glucose-1-phosphate uridylyltransferase [Acidimicrobiaceae bacterium]
MERAGIAPTAISVFERQLADVRAGAGGLLRDADIDPYHAPALGVPSGDHTALAGTAMIRLNGGLGTSMGMEQAKSLLEVRDGLSFLDIIVRQVQTLRSTTGARLPLSFLHSFRTSADSLAALAKYPDLAVDDLPIELMQHRVPKLLADELTPVSWPDDPELEWCPPGHGDLYTVLHATGFLDRLAERGFERVFVANSDNLGAVPDPEVASWFANSGAPFAIEAVRRTPSDRKGGHFAIRKSDGRLILRETAQTPPDEQGDIDRHPFTSTNNLWFDVAATRRLLDDNGGDLGLPVIINRKTVDPTAPESPKVVQLETAMGAAVEVFDGATTVEVGRDRFIPVKTTDDLLVVRSDCYRLTDDFRLVQVPDEIPFVELAPSYKLIDEFDLRFPAGAPSLAEATSLVVRGDWTFGAGVRVVGDAELGPEGGTVPDGAVLGS